MKHYLLLVVFILSGCVNKSDFEFLPNKKCTEAELKQVKQFFDICNESSYASSHCFQKAIDMYCTGDIK